MTHIPATDTDTLGQGEVGTLCGRTVPAAEVKTFLRGPIRLADYPTLDVCHVCAALRATSLREETHDGRATD